MKLLRSPINTNPLKQTIFVAPQRIKIIKNVNISNFVSGESYAPPNIPSPPCDGGWHSTANCGFVYLAHTRLAYLFNCNIIAPTSDPPPSSCPSSWRGVETKSSSHFKRSSEYDLHIPSCASHSLRCNSRITGLHFLCRISKHL